MHSSSVALHASHAGAPAGPAAEPLLIAHGLLGSSTNWGGIARHLGKRTSTWSLDLRNHGRSPHADTMNYPAMADDVLRWMDDHDHETVTLLGHSMGGKAAMWLALNQPSRVSRLIVVDIAPRVSPGDHRHILEAMQALDLACVTSRRAADAALAPAVSEAAVRAWLLQNLLLPGSDRATATWRVNLAVLAATHDTLMDWPDASDLAPYRGPTLFVGGANSTYLGSDDEACVNAHFSNASIARIPDAGHWVHAEQPAAFIEAVDRFLDGSL